MMNTNKNANRVFFILLAISIILIVLRLTPTIQAIKQLAYSILVPDIKISSTKIRERIFRGESIEGFVPKEVEGLVVRYEKESERNQSE